MYIAYNPNHHIHDPAQLHRPEQPHLKTFYGEIAQRGDLIAATLQEANLGSLAPPSDFGLAPIADVHSSELISFLQDAYGLLTAETRIKHAIPTTFRVGPPPAHKPVSIWGLLGYYCFDTAAPIFAATWEAAYWSAQTAVSAAAHLNGGDERLAYALCRPPGHHAGSQLFGGFCYLNNAAIAAQWLVRAGQRVALLDIDYHHGNGTQEIFFKRADVLTCSLHVDPLRDYPYYWGYADEVGDGVGKDHNFNFPLPFGTDEALFAATLDEALDQIRAFAPDVLVLSFGADTLAADPLGQFQLTVDSYMRLGEQIAELVLPTVVVQEGGYLLAQLGKAVVSLLKGLSPA